MTTRKQQLSIAGTLELAVSGSPEARLVQAAAQAFERAKAPYAAKTQEAYQRAWDQWGEWCARTGARPLPIDPQDLVSHLEWLSIEGAAPNSVRLALSALCTLDRRGRVTPADRDPQTVRSAPVVQDWLRAWAREHPSRPRRQAAAITARELRRVLALAAEGPGKAQARHSYVARYARDRCLLLVGIYGALRVSEVVGLELSDGRMHERGLELTLRSSKTDQGGDGASVPILPAGDLALCPVEAWRAWLQVRGTHEGPVFVEVTRDGQLGTAALTARSANRIVQRLAKRAGLELVTSHSMRATFVTLAVTRGKPLPLIAQHTRHKSFDTLSRYVRQAELFGANNPTAGLLDE